MKRKLSVITLSGVVISFIAVLTFLIAAVLLAQTFGAGQTTGKTNAVLAPEGTSASAQAERPLIPWADGAGRFPVIRPQTKRRGARPMDSNPPFFLPPVIYNPLGYGFEYVRVAIADVNGDGKPDLLVANRFACSGCATGSVAVLLGNGDGTFQPAVDYDSVGSETESVVVADVNGDGKPDIVLGNGDSGPSVAVLLGNGNGTFQPGLGYETMVGGTNSIAVADLNGDGKLDVAALGTCYSGPGCTQGDGAIAFLWGIGDGTFETGTQAYDSGGTQAVSIAVADVNRDGKPDLVVANEFPGKGQSMGSVGVLLGNGDGTFQPVVDYPVRQAFDVIIADVNGDGKPDILAVSAGECVVVMLGNGDGTFQPGACYDTGGDTVGLAVGDINGDGLPDIVASNEIDGTVAVLLGNGDGTFQPAVTQTCSDPRSLALRDLNGDGRIDLVVGSSDGSTYPLVGVMLHVGATPTTTALVSSLNPSVFGQLVPFTATVSSGSGTPTGTVAFFDGSTLLGSATLAAGSGSISVSTLGGGSNSITAVYQGSLKFDSGVSTPIQQVVNPATTTSALASSLNPALVKDSVTYTATVTSQYGGAVTGTVTFKDGGSTVATVTMAGNQAAYTTTYKVAGVHLITATYSGDSNNVGSVSPPLAEQINNGGFASTTVLTTSGSPSHVGQPVTFTATVTSKHGPIPDGELVAFYDGKTEIGTDVTARGAATFTTSSLSKKTHTIKGTYAGDDTFRGSTGSVKQVVEK